MTSRCYKRVSTGACTWERCVKERGGIPEKLENPSGHDVGRWLRPIINSCWFCVGYRVLLKYYKYCIRYTSSMCRQKHLFCLFKLTCSIWGNVTTWNIQLASCDPKIAIFSFFQNRVSVGHLRTADKSLF